MDPVTRQVGSLDKLLNATAMRQRVLAQNIANVNTPGYHRQDVAFEEHLAGKLDGSTPIAIAPQVFELEGLEERADGNNVDIDKEIGALNRNAMMYQTRVQVLSSRLAQMQHAIRG